MVGLDAPDFLTFQNRTITTDIPVLLNNTSANKLSTDIPLSSGVINRVRIRFPRGCNDHIHIRIMNGSLQIFPQPILSYLSDFHSNDETIDINPAYHLLRINHSTLRVLSWNDNDTTGQVNCNHVITIIFDIQVGGT
jgi:hypothetical protein